MAVLGGGRIVVVAGGTPRDPAVGAITTGAVAEFVRTTAPDFAAQGVSINGIIASLPVPVLDGTLSSAEPTSALPAGGGPGSDTVVDSLPQSSGPRLDDDRATNPPPTVPEPGAPADEVTNQAPVIPFPAPADTSVPPAAVVPAAEARHDHAAPAVATAVLFLSPATAALTGQVIRIDG